MSDNQSISKRTLGKTNIEVTPIGLGMMEFSGGGGLVGSAFPVIGQGEKMLRSRQRWMAALTGSIRLSFMGQAYPRPRFPRL